MICYVNVWEKWRKQFLCRGVCVFRVFRGSEGVWRVTACALIIRGRGRDDSSWITRSNAVKCTQTNKTKNVLTLSHTQSNRRFASSTRLIVWQLWLINHSLFSSIPWINEGKKHEWSSPSFPVSTFHILTIALFTETWKKLQKQVELYNVKLL